MVVASKVPLPNYRPDLDDKRPQREVLLLYIDNMLCKLFFMGFTFTFLLLSSLLKQCSIIQVTIPLSVQRRVESLLQEHLDRIKLSPGKCNDSSLECKASDADRNLTLDGEADSMLDVSVVEKILQRRSLRLRNMQRAWHVCWNSNHFQLTYFQKSKQGHSYDPFKQIKYLLIATYFIFHCQSSV